MAVPHILCLRIEFVNNTNIPNHKQRFRQGYNIIWFGGGIPSEYPLLWGKRQSFTHCTFPLHI